MTDLPDWDFDFTHGTKEGWKTGDYVLANKEDFDKLTAFADSTEGWSSVVDKKAIKVWDRSSKTSAINLLKIWAHFPGIKASTLYDVLHDPDYRKTWDDNMVEGTLLQQLDPFNDVGYYRAKSPFFALAPRDFCNTRAWYVLPDKSQYIIMNHSVPHEKRPEKKGVVRAISLLTGYVVRVDPEDENSCHLIYVTQSDPKGWVPAWAMNQATKSFAPGIITKMGKVAKKYNEWKANNNPDTKIWLSTEPYHWETNGEEDEEDKDKSEKKKKKKKSKKSSEEKEKKEE